MKKNTTFILYQQGAYGTFIEWCLNYFTDDQVEKIKLTDSGSAHQFHGHALVFHPQLENYCKGHANISFARLHPGATAESYKLINETYSDSFKNAFLNDLSFLNNCSDKVIILFYSDKTMLWGYNNYLTKSNPSEEYDENYLKELGLMLYPKIDFYSGGIVDKLYMFAENINRNSNINMWGVDSTRDLAIWQIREFLSLSLITSLYKHCDQSVYNQAIQKFTNFKFVEISNLRDNFHQVLVDLIAYTGNSIIRADEIDNIYTNWIKKQYHAHKDQEISTIVSKIVSGQIYDWSDKNLNLLDEIFLQHHLRLAGIEIRCYNLNIFPTNTKELEQFLIRE